MKLPEFLNPARRCRAGTFAAVALVSTVLGFATTGCRAGGSGGGAGPTAVAVTGLEGGSLVFSDDFDGASLSDAWRARGDAWGVEDGWVRVQGARNDALWLSVPLPERVRVEFRAKSLSQDGDIKFEIFGDGATHESGYVGIFGGWNNRLNIIARLDEHGDDRVVGAEGRSVEIGREYAHAIVRDGDAVRWYIDGEHFLSFEDEAPLRGAAHAHFGFNNWDSDLRFTGFRVYDLAAVPEP